MPQSVHENCANWRTLCACSINKLTLRPETYTISLQPHRPLAPGKGSRPSDARSALTTIPAHRAAVCPECCQLDAWCCCSPQHAVYRAWLPRAGARVRKAARASPGSPLSRFLSGAFGAAQVASTALQLPDTPTKRGLLLPIVPKHDAAK